MTRDDIIRMAREAGFPVSKWDDRVDEVMDGDNYHIQTDLIECFAALVAAAEREACAKVCEEIIRECCYDGEAKDVAEFLADEIRWRDENESKQEERNREWQGLTGEEVAELTLKHAGYPVRLTEAIEAKLKEKNT